jgi:arylsulfatase
VPAPLFVNGIQQAPLEGVSMLAMLRNSDAPENHDVQYFEIMGNRGIYYKGWTAVTKHRTPWLTDQPSLEDDVWELYGPDDWTQANNLATQNPEKLAELQRLWLIEAVKYNVVPLDDRAFERINPDIAGRPQLISGDTQLLFSGMRVSENCILNMKNKSHSVTARLEVPDSGASGVIVTQGGSVGGWSLYVHEGRLKYCYNFFGIEYYIVVADRPVPAGRHDVRMEFAYDGGGLAKGGMVTLYYDGTVVGTGRVERTEPMGFSADEACDVGSDTGSPASPDYGPSGNKFTGKVDWVKLDIGQDSHDHLVTAEDKLNIAMARQ